MGNQMLMVAVAWHMYDITASAWDLGLVGLFQFVPALLMTLPAGHLADRVHRGRIFACCMALQAVVATLMLVSTTQGFATRELILGLAVVLGVARAFQMPAQQALIPLLVPASLLHRAFAISSTGMEMAIIGGPALGGLLYALGPRYVYIACMALLLSASVLTMLVRYQHKPPQAAATWHSLFAGIGFVWRRKVILGATSLDLFAVLLGGATALLPIYAKDILHTGPAGLGLLRSAPAVGALAMSLVLTRWPLRRKVGPRLLMAVGALPPCDQDLWIVRSAIDPARASGQTSAPGGVICFAPGTRIATPGGQRLIDRQEHPVAEPEHGRADAVGDGGTLGRWIGGWVSGRLIITEVLGTQFGLDRFGRHRTRGGELQHTDRELVHEMRHRTIVRKNEPSFLIRP